MLGFSAYVIWGLLDGYEISLLLALPVWLGTLVGFFLLVPWLSGKVPDVVVGLVYSGALAVLGWVLWQTTEETAVVAVFAVPIGIMGLIFLAVALAGRETKRRTRRVAPDT